MENYNDSFYNGGDALQVDNVLTRFTQTHVLTATVFAIIGFIAVLIVFILIVSKIYGNMFSKDSFVGTYMHWRPNVQDKSELNAIMDANRVDPPLPFPMGLLKNGSNGDGIETNLGSY